MEKAAFSLENYLFDKINIDLSKRNSNDIALKFNTQGVFNAEKLDFDLQFSVSAYNKNKTVEESFIFVSCHGLFKFHHISTFEEIPSFFYRNAIAILFPYLRSFVSIVTTQANNPGVILPTLNLSSLEGDLRNATSIK